MREDPDMANGEARPPQLREVVRAELSELRRALVGGVGSSDAGDDPERVAAARRALAVVRQRDAGGVGRLGERVARVRAVKPRVPSLSGTARYRIPDILTATELIEVKNVARLRLSPQLRDFLAFAESSGRTFVLLTRFDTVLAPALPRLIDERRITHRHFSGLLSAQGRRFLRELIESSLEPGGAIDGTATGKPGG
jgi:hypothetical protein